METAGEADSRQDGARDRRQARWCRACGEPVTAGLDPLAPFPHAGKAVHTVTGQEKGPDGHLAVPTGTDPAKEAVARRVGADYPEYEVGVFFGIFRAVRRGVRGTPVPVEGSTEEELRAGLNAARGIAKWANR